jgi:hypothetical protein
MTLTRIEDTWEPKETLLKRIDVELREERTSGDDTIQ